MIVDKEKAHLAMARACMNPQDIAKTAEMPPQTVNRFLLGRKVTPKTVGRIANALRVDPTEIIQSSAEG